MFVVGVVVVEVGGGCPVVVVEVGGCLVVVVGVIVVGVVW